MKNKKEIIRALNKWTDDKKLADSYMELIYVQFYPNAIIQEDKSAIKHFENKIKEYEKAYGPYTSPLVRLSTLNTMYQHSQINLKEYLEEVEVLCRKLKLFAEAARKVK